MAKQRDSVRQTILTGFFFGGARGGLKRRAKHWKAICKCWLPSSLFLTNSSPDDSINQSLWLKKWNHNFKLAQNALIKLMLTLSSLKVMRERINSVQLALEALLLKFLPNSMSVVEKGVLDSNSRKIWKHHFTGNSRKIVWATFSSTFPGRKTKLKESWNFTTTPFLRVYFCTRATTIPVHRTNVRTLDDQNYGTRRIRHWFVISRKIYLGKS